MLLNLQSTTIDRRIANYVSWSLRDLISSYRLELKYWEVCIYNVRTVSITRILNAPQNS